MRIQIRVVSYCVILKMAVNIKDLYGNSGKRFQKINTRYNFQYNTPFFIYFACCLLCGYFPNPLPGFYLGFIVWGRSPEWPKATSFLGGSFFEMKMPWDAIWCILRHNFEKYYSVCTDLVASGWFSDIVTYIMMTICCWGGSWVFWGPTLLIEPWLRFKHFL